MRELASFKTTLTQNHQWPPVGAPMYFRRDEPGRSHFDDSVNAVSFGFVATAILISMFLVMAIFEKLIRTTTSTSSDSSPNRMDSRIGFNGATSKLGYQSPKMTVYSNGVSVLMPGDNMPTFIAHPVPAPAPAPAPEPAPEPAPAPATTPYPPEHIHHSSSRDSSTPSFSSSSIQEC